MSSISRTRDKNWWYLDDVWRQRYVYIAYGMMSDLSITNSEQAQSHELVTRIGDIQMTCGVSDMCTSLMEWEWSKSHELFTS